MIKHLQSAHKVDPPVNKENQSRKRSIENKVIAEENNLETQSKKVNVIQLFYQVI